MIKYMGIDPGLNGAIAMIDDECNLLSVSDMPTFTHRGKQTLDHYEIARIMDNAGFGSKVVVTIEKVGSRPGEGHVGAFTFGECVGVVRGAAAMNFWPIYWAPPQEWKRWHRIPKPEKQGDKTGSLEKIKTLYPSPVCLERFRRKMDADRAEAVLIHFTVVTFTA